MLSLNFTEELKKKKDIILLFTILVFGFILRLYHLGSPSLWADELYTAGRIHGSLAQTFHSILSSPHTPLYYILLHAWTGVFGRSEFSLRFPSLMFSTFSIPLIFQLGRKLFNKDAGLAAAFLLSISPAGVATIPPGNNVWR